MTAIPTIQQFTERRQSAIKLWQERAGDIRMDDWSVCAIGQLANANIDGWFHRPNYCVPCYAPPQPIPVTIMEHIKSFFTRLPEPLVGFEAARVYFGLPFRYDVALFTVSSDITTLPERLMAAPYEMITES